MNTNSIMLRCTNDFIVMPPETLVFKKGELYQAKWFEKEKCWIVLGENLKPTKVFHTNARNIDDDDEYFEWFEYEL